MIPKLLYIALPYGIVALHVQMKFIFELPEVCSRQFWRPNGNRDMLLLWCLCFWSEWDIGSSWRCHLNAFFQWHKWFRICVKYDKTEWVGSSGNTFDLGSGSAWFKSWLGPNYPVLFFMVFPYFLQLDARIVPQIRLWLVSCIHISSYHLVLYSLN